ncbi:MAG: hypothetical protein A2Y62_14865 [Candidatus Fischerbacteria bacterium RBG_13_37_8]|uniref:Uncharacterized protein n=1 Tax=Candidatus Fischerbacteria bacterium RBG_13_37_8 TaxID=1817863 RepID=A0A1F5VX48_9BACT|nr:MAG: hypothetical protein A2Y62_14865 [Candidatus Fischerbacteria bacterium RBG_13_37_8]
MKRFNFVKPIIIASLILTFVGSLYFFFHFIFYMEDYPIKEMKRNQSKPNVWFYHMDDEIELTKEQLLIKSSYIGDIYTVNRLLSEGVYIDTKQNIIAGIDNPFSEITPLIASILGNRIDIMQLLIKSGADINENSQNGTALCVAVSFGDSSKCMDFFRKHRLNSMENFNNATNCSIKIANLEVQLGSFEKVNLLIESRADTNIPCDKQKHSLLFYAIYKSRLYEDEVLKTELISLLLNRGLTFNINAENKEILESAHLNKYIKKMIAEGNNRKRIELIEAARNGEINKMKKIIALRNNIDERNEIKETALIAAAKRGHSQIVKFLITKGANINLRDWNGNAFDWAVDLGHFEVAKLLLDAGIDVNSKDNLGTPAICKAVKRHSIELFIQGYRKRYKNIINLLLSRGAKINVKDNHGSTPLMIASELGNKMVIPLLLSFGANINEQDKEGRTALMRAIIEKNLEIPILLGNYKADVSIKDNNGKTALMYAEENKMEILISYLGQ